MNRNALIQEFNPRKIVPSLMPGIVIGVMAVFFHTSLAALIFSGRLSPFLADGIGLVLFGATVVALAVALLSSLPGAVTAIQDSPAAIFALAAAAIAAQMPAGSAAPNVYFTVVTAIALTTLLTGILFIVLGRFGLSNFVRFVPYPVVGGFLAGTGWLLAKGALGVMSGMPVSAADLPKLFQPDVLMLWVPGAVLAVLLLVLLRRYGNPLLILGLLLGGTALFYVILLLTGTSVAEASTRGLLLGPFPPQALWKPIQPSQLALVDWGLFLSQVGKLVSILMVSTIALLLNANALELATRRDIDLNRELVAAGVGNLLAGLGGSPVGYQAIGNTSLAYRLGGGSRWTAIIVAAMTGLAMFFGASVLSFFPKAVLGGLLLYLGLSFLFEWVVDAWRRLPHVDYFLVLTILVIVGAVGFLEGVGAGILIAVVLFVVNYSRVDFIKDTLTGLTYHSHVERSAEQHEWLDRAGGQIHVLRLQGYLFFGTAQALLNRVRERLHDASQPPLKFLLLDFHRVAALDSSAVLGFVRLGQLAESNGIHVALTDLKPLIRERLAQGGLAEGEGAHFHILPGLDYGMEWCEDRLLKGTECPEREGTLMAQLETVFATPELSARFMNHLERMELEAGRVLIHQGDAPEAMYFVDAGHVTAELHVGPGESIRLGSMGGGSVVGEVGMYLKQTRTATVFTTEPSVVYRLSEDSLHEIERSQPEVAAALHQWIARLLARRLSENNQTLEVLLS